MKVPDPHGHDIKLNSFKTSVALRFMMVLQNLITTNYRRSVKSKYDRKLTELNKCLDRANPEPCKQGLSFFPVTRFKLVFVEICQEGRSFLKYFFK